ncbi:MAG: hypothetical protein DRP88_00230 [Candidatus Neomarinimicrobiota bacterium]|nr:hypothetical protein [Candidatus Neomarinimicrobiota bacterium]RKY49224.1 MAG: hypothetical protein DRP88_00230 [Candidatus Neomarinimicrobiota bacterium]
MLSNLLGNIVFKSVFVVILLFPTMCTKEKSLYGNYEKLSENFYLYWNVRNDTVDFKIVAKTNGWVALGFQPIDELKEADIVLGYVKNEVVYLSDGFNLGRDWNHIPDVVLGGKNDIIDFRGKEQNDLTIIEFSRKADTSDQFDKKINLNGFNRIVWLIGKGDFISNEYAELGTAEIIFGKSDKWKGNY